MATTLEIIRGISQVMANSYDGALDKEGNKQETGLKRDEEVSFRDKRVIDGFKVKLSGDKLRLTYHTEAPLQQTHDKKFKDEILQTVADVVAYLKKEYKKVTGNALSLKEVGEPDIEMHNTSQVRNWVVASCLYEIGGIDTDKEDPIRKDLQTAVKDWLSINKKAKKPENDLR